MVSRLNIARATLVLALTVGLGSWWETVSHIGDPAYRLLPVFPEGPTHAWYHAFREAASDVAKMTVFIAVFFGLRSLRTRPVWWLILILMIGYYAPFWLGEPFLPALSAPNRTAGIVHVLMALLAALTMLIAFDAFQPDGSASPRK